LDGFGVFLRSGLLVLAVLGTGCRGPAKVRLLGTLPCGKGPAGLAVSNDGALLAVACPSEQEVWLFGLGQEGTPSRQIPVGPKPSRVDFSPQGELLVAESGADSLARISLSEYKVVRRGRTGPEPADFVFSGDGSRILVSCQGAPLLSVLRSPDLALEKDVALGGSPRGLAMMPSLQKIFVCTRDTDMFSAIQAQDYSVVATMLVGKGPMAAVLSPDGTFAYVACQGDPAQPVAMSGSVAVVRLKDWIQVDSMAVGGGASGMALSPSGAYLFVVCARAGRLDVLSTARQERVATLVLAGLPEQIDLGPGGRRAYVSLNAGRAVAVLDLSGFP
jgi:DNA-binding beta-propeller fold protein YncE